MADTTFQIDVGVTAGGVDAAARSVESLASKLEQARAASTAAADAVKAGEAAYKQTEVNADKAAKALERVGLALAEAKQSGSADVVNKLQQRQKELATAAEKANAALKNEAASLDALKSASTKASEGVKKLENLQKVRDAAAGTGKVNEMAEAFGKLGGPLGVIGQKGFGAATGVKKLGEALGSAGPYVAVAVAIVAITTAILGATAAMTAWAISTADAARTSALLSDGIARSVKGGRELDDTIHRLGRVVPQTEEELRSMASKLADSGLRGKQLSDALETAAVKAAKLKWGPDFQKQTLSLTNQAARLKSNLASLFGGLKIDSLLEKFATLVDLFDKSNVTGQAIKVVFEDLFQPMVDGLDGLVPLAERFFINLEIWVLKALITIKPYGSILKAIGEQFLYVAAGAIAGVGVVIGLFVAAGVAIMAAAAAVQWLVKQLVGNFGAAVDWLKGLSLESIGRDLITGLARGVTGGAGAVVSSITDAVNGGVAAAKKALGIASPSKVFAEIGAYTAEGMAGGVDAKAGEVQGSLTSMVAAPAVNIAAPEGKGGGHTFYLTVNANTASDAQAIGATIREQLLSLLEGDVAQLGGAVPA